MDNLAHTLAGLSLAKAGLERASPLATTALVISSNIPDIDVLAQLSGGTPSYLEYHRGFTHGLAGLGVLAAGVTLLLTWFDRSVRIRRDPFLRPTLPSRIFFICYLGGLAHALMDYTNSYGVRLLAPFSERWFYGDLVFVVDPWIWLLLSGAVVWLTSRNAVTRLLWFTLGTALSLIVALAFRTPLQNRLAIPTASRIAWFVGAGVIFLGAVGGWGRFGPRIARRFIFLLLLYYGAAMILHQTALKRIKPAFPADETISAAAWPVAADPTSWQVVSETKAGLFFGKTNIKTRQTEWQKTGSPDDVPGLVETLRKTRDGRIFLNFARYCDWQIEHTSAGYSVTAHDLRFSLRLLAELDPDLNVTSTRVSW